MNDTPPPDLARADPGRPVQPDPGSTPRHARETALAVAERLRTPRTVDEITRHARALLPADVSFPRWHPAQLLLGHTGIAMLYSRLASTDADWGRTAHAHLSAALPHTSTDTIGDLLLSAALHARAHGGYGKLLERAVPAHASAVRALLDPIERRPRRGGPGLAPAEYDLISGLTRHGRSLMAGAGLGHPDAVEALHRVLGVLTGMARPRRAHGRQVPGWWIDPARDPAPRAGATAHPLGEFDIGLSHGICGPLALLSLAHRAGHTVPGMSEAIRTMADWVMSRRLVGGEGTYWPGRLAFEAETEWSRGAAPAVAPRSDWCYGTAGTARALHLAGRALDDRALTDASADAMRSVFRRPYTGEALPDATFCHGRAGVLLSAVRMAADTGDATVWAGADRLARDLADAFDPTTAFGYRYPLSPYPDGPAVDEPGLLQGAAGVALTLLSYADARLGSPPGPAAWDTALLMA
ncbi:lanthionine synthetase C family protein [Streptomyces hydrogenans]|uniref:lanthionine synthetase C family protein n=1 Tax=Streptomyces hydrogenans TaxID=1873719 RepID=UPI0034170A0F